METDQSSVDLVDGDVVKPFARAALLAALTSAFAFVAIPYPLSPTAVTLQVLGVFLAGIFLGPYWGAVSILLYLAAGAVGAPVFLGGSSGLGALAGPTAGFLWAFPVAALLLGFVVHRGSDLRDPATVSVPTLVVALTAATLLIYAGGVAWYAWLVDVSLLESAAVMALPFVPAELLKMAAAIAIAKSGTVRPT